MKRIPRTYGCPVEVSLELLGGKWKPVILARLKDSPLTYGQLRGAIPALSDKVLSERLKALTEQGLVVREPDARAPDRNLYRLSDRGQSLRPVLEALYAWGQGAARDLDLRIRDGAG
ncbi:putative transcriptional regulator [Caulobacter sp. AP07]|uniref:winged helix-turn-helix transcriptional regulator n=1 Tax=Caulobacter sp. AP07 TaxID=1144304 RepID=UPI000272077A|nr:helix-turn-helix domain-containing protein [Caulobacter sp. AP07]EJL22126.1 putative transcriptional regulator [Caulobacter sp. AP07]